MFNDAEVDIKNLLYIYIFEVLCKDITDFSSNQGIYRFLTIKNNKLITRG